MLLDLSKLVSTTKAQMAPSPALAIHATSLDFSDGYRTKEENGHEGSRSPKQQALSAYH
jgi:hypothetical protein